MEGVVLHCRHVPVGSRVGSSVTATMASDAGLEEPQYRHEAMLYAGRSEFVDRVTPFLREGVAAGEAVLVVVDVAKIDLLRSALGPDAGAVRFEDMATVGSNPARIIPAWQDFLDDHADSGAAVRGIGEPIYAGRTPDELVECEHHEALLNVAFDPVTPFWLVCPYDVAALDPDVVHHAHHNHPIVEADASAHYAYADAAPELATAPLSPAPPDCDMRFTSGSFRDVRAFVTLSAEQAGLSRPAIEDLVLAVNEAATNSVLHGGGRGVLRVWRSADAVVCEIEDDGCIDDRLAGRRRPTTEQPDGRGLWIVNQVCDLVQLRSTATGTTLRLHKRTHGP